MSIVTLAGLTVSESSYRRARQIVNEQRGERKSTAEVLSSLREMMPGWTITTSASQWGDGARNIEISERTLERMAEDPEVMVRYKALILDLDEAVPQLEEWKRANPGRYIEFGLQMDENGNYRGLAMVRTLLGGEATTTFELPTERSLWADLILQKLDSLAVGQVTDAEGNRSWVG
jgi:hypothetical protein